MTRRYTGFTPAAKDHILARSGGQCEVMLPGCLIQASEIQHRRARGMGSTRRPDTSTASNGLAICRHCHDVVESRPDWAQKKGYRVPQTGSPRVEAVWWRQKQDRFLDDAGGFAPPTEHEMGESA